ncbi:MAG: hypothetical protein SFV15_18560 [Polyangiaceae bacterium]|nr:hypothetical protein [Polyangiaceae bacterium]
MTRAPKSKNPPPPVLSLRLEEILRQLPEAELGSIIQRIGISVDANKRIDVSSQVARALLMLPEARDPNHFPGPTRELLYRIAEAKGALRVPELPAAVEPLVQRGMVYARDLAGGDVLLVLPIAFMMQLKSWEGEDPRGLRALLAQLHPDVASSIASHYLGRTATPPVALSLEVAWEAVSDPSVLAQEVEKLAPMERKLLQAIERVGGEVDTEELLDLEREPMRLRGAMGATPSRRGVGFALERRGFLMPVHPNRHLVPTEVAELVGAERRKEREAHRRDIRTFVLGEDHSPRRARFAEDPVPLALAMALVVRDPGVEVRAGVGTPRSLIAKFATRFGRSPEDVAMVAALSRAIGLWDPSAMGVASPPGSYTVGGLLRELFRAWERGGAWDEARTDGEVVRAQGEAREASAVGVIRSMVLEALRELSDGRWAPWEAVASYVRSDSRTPGLTRLIERWAQRAMVEALSPAEIAAKVALESLHVLGIVDLGDPESDSDSENVLPTIRITPRGRELLNGSGEPEAEDVCRFVDNQTLRVGRSATVGQVVALSPFVEIGRCTGALDLAISPQTVSQALSAGFEGEVIQARLEAVAALPDPIARLLAQATAVLGRAEFVATAGFIWVEDPEIRELLRSRRQTADLFIDPSPPSGLLLAAGVDMDRLARRCRSLGVELYVEGEVHRTRSIAPPARGSGARRLDSGTLKPPSSRQGTRGQRGASSRSSQSMPAIQVKRGTETD